MRTIGRKMNETELVIKIKRIEDRMFMINMIDRWTSEDEKLYNILWEEKRKYEKQLDEMRKKRPNQKPHH